MKILSKIVAATTVLTLAVTTFTACGAVDKLTFAQTMEKLSAMENTTSKVTFKTNVEDDAAEGSFEIHAQGKNFSFSNATITSEGETVEVVSPLSFVDNTMYINTESLWNVANKLASVKVDAKDESNNSEDAFENILKEANIDIKKTDIGWLAVPVDFYSDETYSKANDLQTTMTQIFKDTIEASGTQVTETEDGAFKVEVKDSETVKKILTAFKTQLTDNKESLISKATDFMQSIDMNKMSDSVANILMDTVIAVYDEFKIEYTDEDLEEIRKSINESITTEDISAQVEEAKSEMEQQYDSCIANIDEYLSKLDTEEAGSMPQIIYTVSTTVEKGNIVAAHQEISFVKEDTKENINVVVDIKAVTDPVQKPENSKTIPETVAFILSKLRDAGLITEDSLNFNSIAEFGTGSNDIDSDTYFDEGNIDFNDVDTDFNDFDYSDSEYDIVITGDNLVSDSEI